jgi:hypothetical protein
MLAQTALALLGLFGAVFGSAILPPVPQERQNIEDRSQEDSLEARGFNFGSFPIPKAPAKSSPACTAQGNYCSSGSPYCCAADGKGGKITAFYMYMSITLMMGTHRAPLCQR